MKKIIPLLCMSFLSISSNAQQTANLLFHWQDTTLVGSWTYDNTYNECWGMVVNDREILAQLQERTFLMLLIQQIVQKLLLLLEHILEEG